MSKTHENALVLVIDDHPAFRLGVSRFIGQLGPFHVCGQTGSAVTALEMFRRCEPHVVVMDISLPDGDGIELTRTMLHERPELSVLVLSMHEDSLFAIRALRAGASGYLRKDDGMEELAAALRNMLKRQRYVSPRLRQHPLLNISGKPSQGPAGLGALSPRECQVFACMGRGMSRGEIAAILGLSVKTVETHAAHIMRKLALKSSAQLKRLAQEWHAVEPPGAWQFPATPLNESSSSLVSSN